MSPQIRQYRTRVELVCFLVVFVALQLGVFLTHQWLTIETEWYEDWRYDEFWKWILLAVCTGLAYYSGNLLAAILMSGLPTKEE